jgi:hypothetical protein
MTEYGFDGTGRLWRGDGALFDPWGWTWSMPARPPPEPLASERATPVAALARLAAAGVLRPVPVGVVGPRAATPAQAATARALGADLARLGLPVLCGGREGVMEAVAQGVRAAGGLCLGLLPEGDWRSANPHVLPVATGIGKARNVLIAQASRALIAVGGELGTTTEVAFALHFGRPVWGLEGAPHIPGLRPVASPAEACAALAAFLLAEGAPS